MSDRELTRIQARIVDECNAVRDLLLRKNADYGNSAIEPLRVFSKASPVEQLLVRIDDKLKRIQNGRMGGDEDTIQDLIGYLIMLRIALALEGGQ